MRTLRTPLQGKGEAAAAGEPGVPDGSSVAGGVGAADGSTVGSGFCRQIGTLGFGVGVGTGVGRGLGVGSGVGSGCGGTRGSGKCGSPAAESACERFQSGP